MDRLELSRYLLIALIILTAGCIILIGTHRLSGPAKEIRESARLIGDLNLSGPALFPSGHRFRYPLYRIPDTDFRFTPHIPFPPPYVGDMLLDTERPPRSQG